MNQAEVDYLRETLPPMFESARKGGWRKGFRWGLTAGIWLQLLIFLAIKWWVG